MRKLGTIFFAVAVAFLGYGCSTMKGVGNGVSNANTNYNKTYVMTGLFENMNEAREKAAQIKIGETTCTDGLKEAGFDPAAKNVVRLRGSEAPEYIFGTKNYQVTITDPEKIKEYAKEINSYNILLYPTRAMNEEKELFTLNKQNLLVTGMNAQYVIVCKENLVFAHGTSGEENMHKPSVQKQFGGTVGAWLFGALGGGISIFTKLFGL